MQRALIVSGVLGLGTAIVFGAAALASTLFPNGGTVNASWNGAVFDKGGGFAVPAPMPAGPAVIVNEKGDVIGTDQP